MNRVPYDGNLLGGSWGLNGFALKCLAMATMAIDHTGFVLFPQYLFLRVIGRLAFPIYCFLLAEGACRTKNRPRYALRLFLFALLSELPFNLIHDGRLWNSDAQNVMFTLLFGLLASWCIELACWNAPGGAFAQQAAPGNDGRHRASSGGVRLLLWALGVVGAVSLVALAEWMRTDYGGIGVLFILIFYGFYGRRLLQPAAFAVADIVLFGGLQSYAVAAVVPISLYNGKRGPNVKYLFYFFYPAHLLALYVIRYQILG